MILKLTNQAPGYGRAKMWSISCTCGERWERWSSSGTDPSVLRRWRGHAVRRWETKAMESGAMVLTGLDAVHVGCFPDF